MAKGGTFAYAVSRIRFHVFDLIVTCHDVVPFLLQSFLFLVLVQDLHRGGWTDHKVVTPSPEEALAREQEQTRVLHVVPHFAAFGDWYLILHFLTLEDTVSLFHQLTNLLLR